MRRLMPVVLSFFLILSLTGCGIYGNNEAGKTVPQAPPTEIIVSAAASLQDSLVELQKNYAQKNPGVKLTFNFGASGALQQQIEQGAPADLFISAGKTQMDALAQKNLLVNESRVNLLGNELVLVAGKDNNSIRSIQDLAKSGVSKISIGTPESVPAGKYAQESLKNFDLWNVLQPKTVLAKDVTQVLNYVETGNVDAGFVYRSDANGSTKVKVVAVVPASIHSPIIYPAAIIENTKHKQEAGDFLKYLFTPEAQQVFTKYGFLPLPK